MAANLTCTMTLNLTEREMAVLDDFAASQGLSKTTVVRQALMLYQLVNDEIAEGRELRLGGKPVLLAAVGLGRARSIE